MLQQVLTNERKNDGYLQHSFFLIKIAFTIPSKAVPILDAIVILQN